MHQVPQKRSNPANLRLQGIPTVMVFNDSDIQVIANHRTVLPADLVMNSNTE